jgi:putative holliday junction resolvase
MRYLAIDLGDKRTGVAVGDSITRLVTPLEVIEIAVAQNDGQALIRALIKVVEEHLGPAPAPGRRPSPGELVVGLPMNMDGSEGQRARFVRQYAARIAEHTGRTVHLHDERLTSAAADWSMARSGLTHKQKKGRRDALAAAAILNDFLVALAPSSADAAAPSPAPSQPLSGNRMEAGES